MEDGLGSSGMLGEAQTGEAGFWRIPARVLNQSRTSAPISNSTYTDAASEIRAPKAGSKKRCGTTLLA